MSNFLATYLLHSTLLLGLLLPLLHFGRLRQAAVRDVVLKVGLLTALGTALFVTFRPAPVSEMPGPVHTAPTQAETLSGTPNSTHLAARSYVLNVPSAPVVTDWARWLFMGSLFCAALRFGLAWHSLKQAQLNEVHDPTILKVVSGFRPVRARLYWTALPYPFAWGHRYILLPQTAPSALTPSELESVLAHEYAHLLRRDPLWNAALSFLTLLLWFQPLNWLALRMWRNAAEERCDAWAAGRTAPLTLAQALLNLAKQSLPAPPSLSLLANPASGSTPLTRRITALLSPQEKQMNRPHWLALTALPILLGSVTTPLAVTLQSGEKIVVLDAGHGGPDPGAVGYANESEVVFQITQLVEQRLRAQGVKVILTPREGQEYRQSLESRSALAVQPANLFVSIHADASTQPEAQGLSVYLYATQTDIMLKTQLQAVAERLLTEMASSTGAKNQGVRPIVGYTILSKAKIPAVLVEVGYVTNPSEGQKLNDPAYQRKIADALAQAILKSL